MTAIPHITAVPEAPTCVDRICELTGRDRAVAEQLRQQAARLLKLAEVLDTNAAIGTAAAAEMLAD